jgi:hypothetical protein
MEDNGQAVVHIARRACQTAVCSLVTGFGFVWRVGTRMRQHSDLYSIIPDS